MSILSLGIMSGTSMDGVDLALVDFTFTENHWFYNLIDAKTVEYEKEWKKRLSSAHKLSTIEFLQLHNEYGILLGKLASDFLISNPKVHLIASHGHTIFHQPEIGLTFQLGNGTNVAATSGITTVFDFRSLDVALGGQGAPLVPIGDELLFSEYKYCLNLGGFANISYWETDKRVAFDIVPVNYILNMLVSEISLDFDWNGEIGSKGKINQLLLDQLNSINYYHQKPPKSLGREWCEQYIIPIILNKSIHLNDRLATYYEHIATTISLATSQEGSLFITGGGAKNQFLIKKIKEKTKCELIIPDQKLIDFKEAIIFAFLGVLRNEKQINTLSSVTGATCDSVGGAVFRIN